jgi:hypothetical protein
MNNDEPINIDDDLEDRNRNENERLTTADMAGASAAPTRARMPEGANELTRGPEEQSEQGFEPLFDKGEAEQFRSRWYAIQAGFVDEPRKAVQEADELVAAVMKRLAEVFAGEREKLESDWDRGDDISTEDLRVALRRYRSFFDRLLQV